MRLLLAAAILTMVFVCIPGAGLTQPMITAIDGNLSHGTQITLHGFAFGHKDQAAPLLWDDFEDGVAGEWTDRPGSRYNNRSHGPVIYNDGSAELNGPNVSIAAYSGNIFLHNRRQAAGAPQYPHYNYGGFNAAAFVLPEPTDEIYISYYWRYDVYSTFLYNYAVCKQARVIGEDSNYYSGPGRIMSSNMNIEMGSGPSHAYEDGDWLGQTGANRPALGEWQRIEIYKKNSDPGENDGVVWSTAGGQVVFNLQNVMTKQAGSTWQQESVNLGMMIDGCAPNPATGIRDCDIMQSVDDFYIDSTRARVEIGNAGTFLACTHREIQIPSAWATDEITVTINQGRFETDQQAWIYVVDADGDVSSGVPVTWGDAGGESAPGVVVDGVDVATNQLSAEWTAPDPSYGTAAWYVLYIREGEGPPQIAGSTKDTQIAGIPVTSSEGIAYVLAYRADGILISASDDFPYGGPP